MGCKVLTPTATSTAERDGKGISKRALTLAEVSAPILHELLQYNTEASLGENEVINLKLFPQKSSESLRSDLQQFQRSKTKGQILPPAMHTLHDYFMWN